MSVIDEVKGRTDIAGVVSQYVALKKAGRNLIGLCPFHSERNPSFFIYPEQQSWHCFGCNTGGDVFSFIMKKENMDFGEALRLLADRAGVAIPSRGARDEEKEEREPLYKINEAAARYFHNLLLNSPEGRKAKSYIQSRGFTDKTAAEFQLGYSANKWDDLKKYLQEQGYAEEEQAKAGLMVESEGGRIHDRFRNKLMFPIWDIKGRVIGFGARVLDDSLPKYVNSPQTPAFDKSRSLYGINLAAPSIRQQDTAVIVEGYVDVITAHQNGLNNVVASMGTSVTESQVSSLKRLTKINNIVLALDADAAGEEAMLRVVGYENTLEANLLVAILPKGKDPDDMIKENPEAWQKMIAEAIPIMSYTLNMIAADLDMTQEKNRFLVASRFLEVIADIKDYIKIDHYLGKLSKLTGLSYRKLEEVLSEIKSDRQTRLPRREITKPSPQALFRNRLEEDYLSLLLHHPECKANTKKILPEFFLNSENREVFIAWTKVNDLNKLRETLAPALHEHLDIIASRELPSDRLDDRDADYRHRLEERFYKNMAARTAEILALEVQEKGAGADLIKLQADKIDYDTRLKEIYKQKSRKRLESRR